MDEVAKLLAEVAHLGVMFSLEDGHLRISAPRGMLPIHLHRRVAESKDEIIRRLQEVASAKRVRSQAQLESNSLDDSLSFPLSDLQLGFYIANDPYMEFHVRPHCYFEFDLPGLDPVAYEAAWNKALTRHRRELCIVTKEIELNLLDDVELRCKIYDLRGSKSEDVMRHLLTLREEMKRQELPLETWPWLDVRISRWNEDGQEIGRVHYNHNNFFVDGFGTMQFLHEIDEYYFNPRLSYPPLTLSYRDAVLGLNRLAESDSGNAARKYWTSRLLELPSPPSIPQRPGFNRRCRSQLERREGRVEKPLWDAFKNRAAALGITPSNAMITAYAYVIATWSNSDHFILSQMATRRFAELHPDLLRMLGNFVSLYPLEIKLTASAPFADNARSIQRQVAQDIDHLQIGGMQVLQELNRLQGSFGTAPSPFVVGSGLSLRKQKKAVFTLLETSQTILDCQFFELEDGSCYYVWDVMEAFFPDGVVGSMWDAFKRMLHILTCDGNAWDQADFDLVSACDLGIRRKRNQTAGPVPASGLHDALGRESLLRGEKVVLQSARGTLTYGALETESNALAAELQSRGVRKGNLVSVVMDRDHELLVALLAILTCGAAYVPIDPGVPSERLGLLLTDSGSSIALTQQKYIQLLAWPNDITPVCVSLNSPAISPSNAEVVSTAGDMDLAYVIYTSGSTGRPKGVMIPHRGALNTVLDINERFNVGPADRLFGVSGFNFDLSVYDIFGALAAGASLVYPSPDSSQDPTHWLELTLQENVTIWNSVPALVRLWVETAARRRVQVPSLRLVLLSGDKIPLDLPAAVRRIAPNAQIISLGGATEASVWSILYPIGEVEPTWSTIPYGYPMRNQRWHVRDRNGKDCPTWVPGELMIGGIGVADGYWNDSEKTKHSFFMDSHTGERLYRTGDLGRYLPDGCIEWMGRIDFQVKVQGQRVELGEVEAALVEHPAVAQAVVALEETGTRREPRLVGYIVPLKPEQIDVKELEAFAQKKLPVHMVPTAWRILEQLPLTANGKVDRKGLPKGSSSLDADSHRKGEYVAPAGVIEEKLQMIWQQILDVPRIGVTDDFFELGGQSFDAIRIFALTKEEFGQAHTLSDIWRTRTIRKLAEGIGRPQHRQFHQRIVSISCRSEGEPLILVHPAGGSVTAYSQLGERIARPLYGIQAEPRLADANKQLDIVDMAKEYVSELRQQQLKCPYLLGGWSSGAMIAFEMAAQLEAGGDTVHHVFILDGPTPSGHCNVRDENLLLWFLQDLGLGVAVERLDRSLFTCGKPDEQLGRAIALLDSQGEFGLTVESLLPSFQIFKDVVMAGTRYRPRRISADVTVIRVEEDIVEEFSTHPSRDENDWGWGRFTEGILRCIRVPGTHHTFLKHSLVGTWCGLFDTQPTLVGRA